MKILCGRRIRFRGKRIDNGKWAYGGYLLDRDGQVYIASPWLIGSKPSAWLVDQETVGRWTGFQDTNSCDIYEDDILRAWESDTSYWTGRVRRNGSGEWQVRLFNATRWAEETLRIVLRDRFPRVEVIGNAHDNPELLEGVRE